nr:N-acetyltransferase [Ureaplasma urealyticum]
MASLYQMFNDANYEIVIVEYEQKNIGYLIYMKTIDFNEILKIGVDENYRNLKVGSVLIDLLKQKKQNILLEVSSINENALNFYLKRGFIKQSIRKKYYADNSDAILMIWKYNTQ